MAKVQRVLVEKRPPHDVAAQSLLRDIRVNLGIESLLSVRILNSYDIEIRGNEDVGLWTELIFSEPPVDDVFDGDYLNEVKTWQDVFILGSKYLPGQFDQRADSAMQCISALLPEHTPLVESGRFFICFGNLTETDKAKIEKYCINPVDSMVLPIEIPKSLGSHAQMPEPEKTLDGFIQMNDDEIAAFAKKQGLAMSPSDLICCRDYFRDTEKRDPFVAEIKVIDTYWSDHCRHTTFLTAIEDIVIEDDSVNKAFELYLKERNEIYTKPRDITLMDVATMGMKVLRRKGLLNDLDESDEINACSIVIDANVNGKTEQWLLQFKNETHNHPTEIEPFGGAATCLGGAIRDPLSGRAFVYQAMRVTGSADPRTPVNETLPGKLPQIKITTQAAAGYSSYGNQIGLTTGLVDEVYHPGYAAKRMEIGAVVGAVKREYVRREEPSPGDVVVLVGGRTGRDGLGGATGSSKEHTEESIHQCGAEVQKGNAPTERKLQRLFRNPDVSLLIKRCNDFGAGGVCVAIGELAAGLDIDLNAVPKKYEGLSGTELAISESQERMAVVVAAADAHKFIELAAQENLEAVEVARVTNNRRLTMNFAGQSIVNISRDFLDTNGARQTTKLHVVKQEVPTRKPVPGNTLREKWLNNLGDLNVCSKKGLIERFDSNIGAATVLMPLGGKRQLTPAQAMAAKIPVLNGTTDTASLMAYGFNPEVSQSPYYTGLFSVLEAVSKIVATGGDYSRVRLSLQEYFEKLGNDPVKWGKPFAALLGAFHAQMGLGIPAIGGKDSMSGSFENLNVPPTLVAFAVTATTTDQIISPEFKKENSDIIYLSAASDKDGVLDFETQKQVFDAVRAGIKQRKILSAYALDAGGIAGALSKMALGNDVGFDVNCPADQLFDWHYGGFVLEWAEGSNPNEVLGKLSYKILGKTKAQPMAFVNGEELSLCELENAWTSPLEPVFPTGVGKDEPVPVIDKTHSAVPYKRTKGSVACPHVIMPVFPGTNCEYDMAKSFEMAGATVKTMVIRNMTVNDLEESIRKLAAEIEQSQILAFPGGFSAGDEPEGSGKFIAAIFRNPLLSDSVAKLLDNDGLILGICNGFQALIKLGLLPGGQIKNLAKDSPTISFNGPGRHVATIARTKVVSTKSPWLSRCSVGEIHNMPISHGEGRLILTEAEARRLFDNGQVATQYVNTLDNPATLLPENPNGSMFAIEGLTDPTGRILGKMGHSERIDTDIYKNVPGHYDQKLFESGVRYFS